jgi:hypothetical protein
MERLTVIDPCRIIPQLHIALCETTHTDRAAIAHF